MRAANSELAKTKGTYYHHPFPTSDNKEDFIKILRHITFTFKDIFYGYEKDSNLDESIISTIDKIKKEKDVPVVVTYIRKRSRQKEDDPTDLQIPNEEIKILNMVDKVIVFTKNEYAILKNNKVETPIEIIGPGVREARFSSMNDLEIAAFIQYAGINKKDKIAVSMIDPRYS